MNPGNDLFYCRTKTVTRDELEALYPANPEPAGTITVQRADLFPCRRLQAALRLMIDDYLNRGWQITNRNPLTLYRGRAGYQLQNGVLVSL